MSKSSEHKTRTRLAPEARRRQLIRAAAKMIDEHGVDRLQFTDLATAAGVTRPVVYRFFPNRQALLVEVILAFEEEMKQRFLQEDAKYDARGLENLIKVFVNASCDTIESHGAGVWHLLASGGPDPEIAQVGRAVLDRTMAPWKIHIAKYTHSTGSEIELLVGMIAASGRAALNLWLDGTLTREEAVQGVSRGIGALLEAFTQKPESTP